MKLNLPGLIREKLPSGAFRFRVRTEENDRKRITLPVVPGHPDFMAHYLAGRQGKTYDPKDRRPDPGAMTFGWLSEQYELWMDDQVAAQLMHKNTAKQRKAFLKNLRKDHGDKAVDMPRHHLIRIRDTMAKTPGAADNMVKTVRALYVWGIDRGYVKENPATAIPRINKGTGATPWTIDDLVKFREAHPFGTTAHLALTLFMMTACRVSDAIRLGQDNVRKIDSVPHLDWQPAKAGSSRVTVPMLPPLQKALAARKVVGKTFLLTEHGKPFASIDSFGNKFQKWVAKAGLEDRSPHGIRKAAGELLALEGATQYHIMSVHGHTQAKTSEVYTKGVDRQRLASEAMLLLANMDW